MSHSCPNGGRWVPGHGCQVAPAPSAAQFEQAMRNERPHVMHQEKPYHDPAPSQIHPANDNSPTHRYSSTTHH